MPHSPVSPLVTLHDPRGRIVFAEPLLYDSPAEVIYSRPWDWVETDEEREAIRGAFQQVVFDQEPVTITARLKLGGDYQAYKCRAVPVDTNDVVVMITSVPILDDRDNLLTDREVECLRLLVSGKRTADISQAMGIKETTVNTYKQRLKEKLGVDSLAGLITWGCKHLC
ncbi:MAG: LuxR C-terminal-related transcriptional regulator [Pirellulaceae bacterium]